MPANTYRTLRQLEVALYARLGFGAAGSSPLLNRDLLRSTLYEAQHQLYWQCDFPTLNAWQDVTVPAGAYLIDYPTDANPQRILALGVNINAAGASPAWRYLRQGITLMHYDTLDTTGYPRRFELRDQVEFWPKADVDRTVRVFYIKSLGRFDRDNDRCTIDDGLVFLHALATCKAHYKQSDASAVDAQLAGMLSRMKHAAFGQKRFLPEWQQVDDRYAEAATPRPVVV